MSVRTAVRITLMALPLILLSFFVWGDLAPSGTFTVRGLLGTYQSSISKFYPEGRLTVPERAGEGWTTEVLAEPIYVDVLLPRRLERARVRLWYKIGDDAPPRLGLRVGGSGEWRYDLQPFSVEPSDNGWTVGAVDFDLSRAAVENRRVRFVLSKPNLDADHSLTLYRIEVELRGEPLTVRRVARAVLRRLPSFLLPTI